MSPSLCGCLRSENPKAVSRWCQRHRQMNVTKSGTESLRGRGRLNEAKTVGRRSRRCERSAAATLRVNANLNRTTVLQEVVDSARALTGARYGVARRAARLFQTLPSARLSPKIDTLEGLPRVTTDLLCGSRSVLGTCAAEDPRGRGAGRELSGGGGVGAGGPWADRGSPPLMGRGGAPIGAPMST